VQSTTEHTFNVDLENGDYTVTITIGDQSYTHDNIDVYAEDTLKIDDLNAAAGSFMEMAFGVTITDTQLNLEILDDGGTDTNWAITALTVETGSPPPPPTEGYFDFGTTGSPVETDYTQVTETTLYSSTQGYGWTSTSGLSSRDRGTPNNLNRDLVQSTTEHSFNIDLENGDYTVTITIGDQDYAHDNIDVYVEDVLEADNVNSAAGTFQQGTKVITVSDGQLNLRILDDGGTDLNWVLNAITIEPVPS
jgi:fibronectin type 3 domain-containing protein